MTSPKPKARKIPVWCDPVDNEPWMLAFNQYTNSWRVVPF